MKKISFNDYITELKSIHPTPGGGSANSKIAELAIALALKSINISKARKSFALLDKETQKQVNNNVAELDESFKICEKLAFEDQEAFGNFMKVYKLNDEAKTREAVIQCFNIPYCLYKETIKDINLTLSFNPYIVISIASDYKMSLETFKAVLTNSLYNLKINADLLSDEYEDLYNKTKDEATSIINEIDKVIKEFN